MMRAYLLVGFGGGIGAMLRYGAGLLALKLWGAAFPVGTLLINITGSLAMGLLTGFLLRFMADAGDDLRLFAAVGILGGFTTFSAFSLDAVVLIERGELLAGLSYVLLSVVLSVLALYLGLLAMRWGMV